MKTQPETVAELAALDLERRATNRTFLERAAALRADLTPDPVAPATTATPAPFLPALEHLVVLEFGRLRSSMATLFDRATLAHLEQLVINKFRADVEGFRAEAPAALAALLARHPLPEAPAVPGGRLGAPTPPAPELVGEEAPALAVQDTGRLGQSAAPALETPPADPATSQTPATE